jgi:membrane protein implicated in regulation of membrane protease activity
MLELLDKPWIIWIAAAVVFAILEVGIPYFCLIFVSFGALVASVVSLRSGSMELQLVAFAIALMLGLFLLRPRIIAKMQSRINLPTRTESLLGKLAIVTEAVEPGRGLGRVEVEGQDWAAVSDASLNVGEVVKIESADGIVLNVKKG